MGDSTRAPAAVWLRRLAPWLVAAIILGFLAVATDLTAAADAVARVPLLHLFGLMVALVGVMVVTDTLALWVTFREAIPAARVGLGDTFSARAPSYLLAIINYGAGQGGVMYFLKRNHGVPVSDGVGAVLLTTAVYVLVVTMLVGVGLLAGAVPDDPELRRSAGLPRRHRHRPGPARQPIAVQTAVRRRAARHTARGRRSGRLRSAAHDRALGRHAAVRHRRARRRRPGAIAAGLPHGGDSDLARRVWNHPGRRRGAVRRLRARGHTRRAARRRAGLQPRRPDGRYGNAGRHRPHILAPGHAICVTY